MATEQRAVHAYSDLQQSDSRLLRVCNGEGLRLRIA